MNKVMSGMWVRLKLVGRIFEWVELVGGWVGWLVGGLIGGSVD